MDPRSDEFFSSLVPFLDGDAVPDVVLPRAVDLEVPLCDAFVADVELLHDPFAALVARDDADLEAVQRQLFEPELHDDGHRFGEDLSDTDKNALIAFLATL